MTDEDAALEDYISAQGAVDDAIIGDKIASEAALRARRRREKRERSDALPWEERYRDVNAAIVFASIMVGSMATMIIDPSLMPITLPISIAIGILASIRRGRRRGKRPRKILPEVDEHV